MLERIEKLLERVALALEAIAMALASGKSNAVQPSAPPAPEVDPFGEETPPPAKLTAKDIVAKAKETADKVGKEKVIDLIKKFKVTKASEVPEDKFDKFVSELAKLK